jgi:lambda family phage portal protein
MKMKTRRFDAAKGNRTLSAWALSSSTRFDTELEMDLESLRTRSRDLTQNDPYAMRYVKLVSNNVIGPSGIDTRIRAKDTNGALDTFANDRIRTAFLDWSRSATVDGTDWITAQRLFVETTIRDGEVLVQLVPKRKFGKYGFALRFLEAEHLDVHYNAATAGGNIIRNGIEYDEDGVIVAYHIWKYHPYDLYERAGQARLRIPKEDLIHAYIKERASGNRGYPWLASGMINLQHLKEYQKSELIAARAEANKIGIATRPKGEDYPADGDDADDARAVLQNLEPGSFDLLPDGYSVELLDPTHPNSHFDAFLKAVLRGVAAAGNVSYHSLANDLTSTNYSSARIATIEEREFYKSVQRWVIETLCRPVYSKWLQVVLLNGSLGFPVERFEKFSAVEFIPRKWVWIDPSKDAVSTKLLLDYKLRSRTEVCKDLGRDFDDVVQEIARENELMKQLGVQAEQVDANIANMIQPGDNPAEDAVRPAEDETD